MRPLATGVRVVGQVLSLVVVCGAAGTLFYSVYWAAAPARQVGAPAALAEANGRVAVVSQSADAAPQTDQSSNLFGVWKLVSIEERDAQGRLVEPLDYGPNPTGMLIYHPSGHMSVHAMRRGRAKLPSDDVHSASAEAAKAAFVGYNAYFGTFEVDARRGVVIHHVEGAMIPNWEGSKQVRRFTLQDDKLILEPPQLQAAGQQRTRRLTWQRVAPAAPNAR